MLTPEENDLLTRVEGDAPMGKLMRQHWTPVCLLEEIREPGGAPVLVEVLGGRYVAFRGPDGSVGMLNELCPHRLASLVYARNEDCGLRCLYHGWAFDTQGNAVSMPSEPEGSPLMSKVKQPSYPVKEWGGYLWAWFGDKDAVPEFDPPAFAPTEDTYVAIAKIRLNCNWAQILEGQIDSAHSSNLHSSDMVPARVDRAAADSKGWYRPSTDKAPRLEAERTSYGFHYAALRRPTKNAKENQYIRKTEYVAPYYACIPPNASYNVTALIVPIDDENSWFHFMSWGDNAPDTETWRKFLGAQPGVHLDQNWVSFRNEANRFQQDRKKMELGDFTGIEGIPHQDIAMWVSMGPIVNRTDDVLGASDIAIVEFRRTMADAAKAVQEGKPAIGTGADRIPQASIGSREGVFPKTVNWRDVTEETPRAGETVAEPA